MRNGERFVLLLFVSLFSAAAWGQTFDLGISPTHYNQFDVENFIALSGATLGTDSTQVTYPLGDTVISVDPQIDDPDHPSAAHAWVPIQVATTAGDWAVRVVATDT